MSFLRQSSLDRLIFYAVLAVVALSAAQWLPPTPWAEALFECSVYGTACLSLLDFALGRPFDRRGGALLLPIALLILLAVAQTLWWRSTSHSLGGASTLSLDPAATERFILRASAIGLTLSLLMQYTTGAKRLRLLCQIVISIALASAVCGLIWKSPGVLGPGAADEPHLAEASFGQFANRNHFDLLMEMAFGLGLGLAFVGRRRPRWPYLAALAPIWAALILSYSRGAFFTMLGQILLLAVILIKRPRIAQSAAKFSPPRGRGRLATRGIALALAAGLLVAGALWLGGDRLKGRLGTTIGELSHDQDLTKKNARRLDIWSASWRMFIENPTAGTGFGAYPTAISLYYTASGRWTPEAAHNDYLELLASGGVPAGLIAALFFLAVLRCLKTGVRNETGFAYSARSGASLGLFGAAAHSFVDYGLHITPNALVFCALTAILFVTTDDRAQADVAPADYSARFV